MSFDLNHMKRHTTNGPVARVVVADVKGSAPREVGASMVVHTKGVDGTIGGGALELAATETAHRVLDSGEDRVDRYPLGPGLGQCCGGAVTLLTERWDAQRLQETADEQLVARPLPQGAQVAPMSVMRLMSRARREGCVSEPAMVDGWMIEPLTKATRQIWIWGAGHVGRALIGTLGPVPDLAISWCDSDYSRFPDTIPEGVTSLVAENPTDLVPLATDTAEHLILTYSHAIDLELCHRILGRSFGSIGLIGSATKWARFRKRLTELGHGPEHVDRIVCPIGDPSLGKHPQAIALGVSVALLASHAARLGNRARA